ncbi:MAG: DNA polymerase III subunit delta [Flavobacteriales bacterium]|nr:DNA polymerase III subunit delta [Flavobacteriales bacterium]
MLFREIIGQESIKRKLIKVVNGGRIPHAQMFVGPEGCGNFAMALAFFQYLSCAHRTETDSCGTCPSCRKHKHVQFADMHFSFPIFSKKQGGSICLEFLEEWRRAVQNSPYLDAAAWRGYMSSDNKQLNIPVKEAADISHKLSLTSYEGGYKMLIMWLPEYMRPVTANKLLKLIEEPPDNTLIIMVANSTENMLSTILSRVQKIKFSRLTDDEVRNGLVTHAGVASPSKVESITRLANGNYWKALQMIQADAGEHFHAFVGLMRMAYKFDMTGLVNWANERNDQGRETAKQFLEYALHMVRQCILGNYTAGQLARLSEDEKGFADNFSSFINDRNVVEITTALEEAYYDISRNINGKLVMFDLSIQMARAIHR